MCIDYHAISITSQGFFYEHLHTTDLGKEGTRWFEYT